MVKNTQKEDVAVLKSDMAEIKPLIKAIHEKLFEGEKKIALNCQDIKLMKNSIYGNGKPGLMEDVRGLRIQQAKWGAIITFLVGIITIFGPKFAEMIW